MTPMLQAVATAVVLFAFFSGILFMAGYTLLAKWWKTEIGWARISLDFGLAMALSPTFLHVAFGVHIDESPAFGWYTVSAIFFVGCIALWNLAIVARVQLRHRRRNGGDAADRDTRPKG